MHPSELKNQALVAAAMAEREGFAASAEAFKLLALACAEEARGLMLKPQSSPYRMLGGTYRFQGAH